MDRLKKAALLTQLIEELKSGGSWCGETHIQKAVYFVQHLGRVPLDYDFILYKHGPFSFDLRDELTALRADGLLKLESQWPYGARIVPTEQSEHIQKPYPKTLNQYGSKIKFIASKLSNKGVVELERLATALYVSNDLEDDAPASERAKRVVELKPHISNEDAFEAVKEVDKIGMEVS